MLDLKYIRENPEAVKRASALKNDAVDVDAILALDAQWREAQSKTEELRSVVKSASKEIGALMKAGDKDGAEAKKRAVAEAKEQMEGVEAKANESRATMDDMLLRVPNLPHESVPEGASEDDNVEVGQWGEKKVHDFEAKEHVEICEALGLVDFARGTKLAGSGFHVFTGMGAKLERALVGWMIDFHVEKHGYTEVSPPFVVNSATMQGTGQLPKFGEDLYACDKGDDLWLIPTAEVPVTNIYANEILGAEDVPKKLVAYTPCFRREAGSHGKEVRGLARVHQFDKVEMVNFVRPEDSWERLEGLRREAEEILEALGLHYRTLVLATGDLSFSAAKCYDMEVYAPGAGRYYEVSSCSNFTDFQARRAGIRFRRSAEEKPEFVHTLNASGVALPRLVIALLETYQQADGSVAVPEPLQHRLGTDVLRPL